MAAVAAMGVAMTLLISGCASDPDPGSSPPPVVTPEPTPTDGPASDPEEEPSDPAPPELPAPEVLIGAEYRDDDGIVVDGESVPALAVGFGACFEGGSGDVCGYSVTGIVPQGPDGYPVPAEATLLVLLEFADRLADGRATWRVLDAVIVRPPDGEPAFLQYCDGEEGVAVFEADSPPGEDLDVTAAWGPNADVTALIELDRDAVTCHYAGP